MGVHYGFDDLFGLGQQVVQATKDAADRFWSGSFSDRLPPDPNPPEEYQYRTPRTGRPDPNYLDGILSDLPSLFSSFAGPDPDDCVSAMASDTAIEQALLGSIDGRFIDDKNAFPPQNAFRPHPAINDNLADVETSMIGWDGNGAKAFNDYLQRFENTVKRQNDVAEVLAIGMRASALTAFAAASGTAPSFIPSSEEHTSIEGSTLQDVLVSLRTNITSLTGKTTRQQQALAGRLGAAGSVVSGEYSDGELSPAAPADTLALHKQPLSKVKGSFYPDS